MGENPDGLSQQYKKENKQVLSIAINIYGSERVAKDVGKRLSKAHTYLQHPVHLDGDIPYNNPHFYEIPRMRKADVPVVAFRGKEDQQTPILDIGQVFEEIDQARKLPSRNVNCHVRTSLLEYDSFAQSRVRN